jgi:hypothetical protein
MGDETIYNVDFTIARYNGTTDMVPGPPLLFCTVRANYSNRCRSQLGGCCGTLSSFLTLVMHRLRMIPFLVPGVHDTLTPTVAGPEPRLQLGPNEDVEWLKGFTTVEDNYEDGLPFVSFHLEWSYIAPIMF